MPTKRKPIARNIIQGISDEELFFLSDGLLGAQSENTLWKYLLTDEALKTLWGVHKESILPEWIRQRPGTRPRLWWDFDAPRITPESLSQLGRGIGWVERRIDEYCEPRKRLGGTGTPHYECLNYVPSFYCGIPDSWLLQREVETYSEIREERDEEPFTGKAIDPNDPPRYESQAEYLKRHNLFELGESRRLQAKSFEPEVVDFEECEEPESAGTVQ